MPLPKWIEPRLCKLATKAPSGAQWAHEMQLDGYRMAVRIEDGMVKLLTDRASTGRRSIRRPRPRSPSSR
jgi:ATP-dependent DNA ligase